MKLAFEHILPATPSLHLHQEISFPLLFPIICACQPFSTGFLSAGRKLKVPQRKIQVTLKMDRRGGCVSGTTLSVFTAGIVAAALFLGEPLLAGADGIPGMEGCRTISNPSVTTVSCEPRGLDRNGRLYVCRSSENCISTSSLKTPSKFGSPWDYSKATTDADKAFSSLVATIEDLSDVTLREINTNSRYLRAEFPSKVPPDGVDDVEFLVKPMDNMVVYRAASRTTIFVYPMQQPLSDQGRLKDRLEGIRRALDWDMYTYDGV
ncbi:unnamed protein product [Choristocarpus tenellus]